MINFSKCFFANQSYVILYIHTYSLESHTTTKRLQTYKLSNIFFLNSRVHSSYNVSNFGKSQQNQIVYKQDSSNEHSVPKKVIFFTYNNLCYRD